MRNGENTPFKETDSILKRYKYLMRSGKVYGENGICQLFQPDFPELWELVKPSHEELLVHQWEGYSSTWWGNYSNVGQAYASLGESMTPLRENIILLMACLNGEL